MDTPKEDGGATSRAERHVVVPVELLERAKYILANNAADGDELAAKIFTALTALSAAPPVQMEAVDRCYECNGPLNGPYCPACSQSIHRASPVPSSVQMEAVAWRVGVPNNEYATLHEDVAEIARQHGYEVTPLYASPVPSPVQMEAVAMPDRAERHVVVPVDDDLVERLRAIRDECSIGYRETIEEAIAALSASCAGGGVMAKIVTSYEYPPIPVRHFDWCAHYDDPKGPTGWGRTEQEAIDDLLSKRPPCAGHQQYIRPQPANDELQRSSVHRPRRSRLQFPSRPFCAFKAER